MPHAEQFGFTCLGFTVRGALQTDAGVGADLGEQHAESPQQAQSAGLAESQTQGAHAHVSPQQTQPSVSLGRVIPAWVPTTPARTSAVAMLNTRKRFIVSLLVFSPT